MFSIFKLIVVFLLSVLILNANDLKKVSLQLQWKYQFQFAGYIIAKEKGFYKDIGLDVDLKEWKHGINMVSELESANTQYAVVRPTSLIDINEGKELIYLAVIFQSSPLILLTDKSSGIKTVNDFKNKRVMTTGDLISDTSIISMMNSQNLSLKDIIKLNPSFNPKDLLNGNTDLMASYISNEPYVLKEMGGTPVIFKPKDFGFDFYNDILATSRGYYNDNKEEVKKFRDATIKGWEYAFSNINETVKIIYDKYNSQNKSIDALTYEANELKKLAYDENNTIGNIEKSKLEKIFDVYRLLGLVKGNINLNRIIFNDLTLNFELSDYERDYLDKKNSLNLCIDPNWMPYEKFDEYGRHTGIASDYYKLFSKILNTNFNVIKTDSWSQSLDYMKDRKCDILSLAMPTPERKEYMNFTTPYLEVPLVIASKIEIPFIYEIKDLVGKKIGIPKGYAFTEILKKKHPRLNIIDVDNIEDGLNKVSKGKLDVYIGTLLGVGYYIQNEYLGILKISGKINENWNLGIGVRNDDPTLLNIMQNAINNLTEEDESKILSKWISVKYENVSYNYKVIGIFIFIIIVISIWIIKVKKDKKKIHNLNLKLKEKEEVLKQINKSLEKLSITDSLTKINNRRKIQESLTIELERAQRSGNKFSIAILDIDYFKNINDTYGHQVGDNVLIAFTELINNHIRKIDIFGRWGGEEFIIIFPNSSIEKMKEKVEEIRKMIFNNQFKDVDKVTVSIGITEYLKNDTYDTIIERVDNALYKAKNTGRNQVVVY